MIRAPKLSTVILVGLAVTVVMLLPYCHAGLRTLESQRECVSALADHQGVLTGGRLEALRQTYELYGIDPYWLRFDYAWVGDAEGRSRITWIGEEEVRQVYWFRLSDGAQTTIRGDPVAVHGHGVGKQFLIPGRQWHLITFIDRHDMDVCSAVVFVR